MDAKDFNRTEGGGALLLTLKGLNPGYIHTQFVSVYWVDTLVLQIVYKWHKRFAQGRMELFDDLRSGRL
jgi:hypothetical protein